MFLIYHVQYTHCSSHHLDLIIPIFYESTHYEAHYAIFYSPDTALFFSSPDTSLFFSISYPKIIITLNPSVSLKVEVHIHPKKAIQFYVLHVHAVTDRYIRKR